MEQQEDYKIITSIDYRIVIETVNEYLKKGYLLSGGIAIIELQNRIDFRYYQAIYKPVKQESNFPL